MRQNFAPGVGMGFTAFLSLLVGMAITSQTLYAATLTSLREYAVLRALGIPRRYMAGMVMAQSLWVGLGGIGLALPVIPSLLRELSHETRIAGRFGYFMAIYPFMQLLFAH